MSPRTLLRFYPRAWRERYADEFLAACDDEALSFQQVLDILAGAIDARFAPQSHLAAAASRSQGGPSISAIVNRLCDRKSVPYNVTDGLKAAGAMIVVTAIFSVAASIGRASHWRQAVTFFSAMSSPTSFLLLAYFTFLKGQSVRARLVLLGSFFFIIAAIVLTAVRL